MVTGYGNDPGWEKSFIEGDDVEVVLVDVGVVAEAVCVAVTFL